MFRSKTRQLIVPQSEHARLAASLAVWWGNKDFDRPPVASDTFLKSVLLHDRAFGYFDTHPIGEMSDEVWIRLQRRGLQGDDGDRVADILIQQHIKRLAGHIKGQIGKHFRDEIEHLIVKEVTELGLDREDLERADRVMALCDAMAFDFSFELPVHSSAFVYPYNNAHGEVEVQYQIHPEGEIQVSPWPFALNSYSGYVLGYRSAEYPQKLLPVFLPYHLVPGMW